MQRHDFELASIKSADDLEPLPDPEPNSFLVDPPEQDIAMSDVTSQSPSEDVLSGSAGSTTNSLSTMTSVSGLASQASTVVPLLPGLVTVLGKETLKEIWKDVDLISLPSWIGRVPNRIGDTKVGKLSADQYRTACTVNLVVTLTRLWGNDERPRYKEMLKNFMDLVTAINLAHRHVITPRSIHLYEQTMQRYLSKLLELYPSVTLTPSQHLSLHLGKMMRSFGPVHAWRCFPFERYNGILQNIPTNCKFGRLL